MLSLQRDAFFILNKKTKKMKQNETKKKQVFVPYLFFNLKQTNMKIRDIIHFLCLIKIK